MFDRLARRWIQQPTAMLCHDPQKQGAGNSRIEPTLEFWQRLALKPVDVGIGELADKRKDGNIAVTQVFAQQITMVGELFLKFLQKL